MGNKRALWRSAIAIAIVATVVGVYFKSSRRFGSSDSNFDTSNRAARTGNIPMPKAAGASGATTQRNQASNSSSFASGSDGNGTLPTERKRAIQEALKDRSRGFAEVAERSPGTFVQQDQKIHLLRNVVASRNPPPRGVSEIRNGGVDPAGGLYFYEQSSAAEGAYPAVWNETLRKPGALMGNIKVDLDPSNAQALAETYQLRVVEVFPQLKRAYFTTQGPISAETVLASSEKLRKDPRISGVEIEIQYSRPVRH